MSASPGELTDLAYWTQFWSSRPPEIGESRGPVRDFVREELVRVLGRWVAPGSRWVEIGCANSTFLHDFPRVLDAQLDGVDIAEGALSATTAAIRALDIGAELKLHDFRDVPAASEGAFDGLFSYGFAEHFNDCAQVHETFARYVRPGGLVVTIVPNLTGLPGLLQQWFDEKTFLAHNVLTTATLAGALEDAGLLVEFCEPIIGLNLGVLNLSSRSVPVRTLVSAFTVGISRAIAALQVTSGYRAPAAHWRSPYLLGVGRRA